jgi:hypothetical protein
MKNNTAAQHKHCKSLSPGQKAQVLTINAAEQKKHRESLSPEQKGKVMAIDAAVHKKQYELLRPEKKVRIMETRAEQCHDYLKEYAQAEGVLAKLRVSLGVSDRSFL